MHEKWKRLHWLAYSKNIFLTADFSNKQSLASTWCHQDERFSKKPCTIVFTRSFGWINSSERPKSLQQQQQLRNCGMWYSVFMFKMVEIDKASYYLPSHQVTFLECVFFFSACWWKTLSNLMLLLSLYLSSKGVSYFHNRWKSWLPVTTLSLITRLFFGRKISCTLLWIYSKMCFVIEWYMSSLD